MAVFMRNLIISCFITLFCYAPVIWADDTEIYTNSTSSAGTPYVMFSLDWRSNLGSSASCDADCQALIGSYLPDPNDVKRFDILRGAVQKVLDGLDNMNVGFMISHDSENNCAGRNDSSCSNGAYILQGLKPIATTAAVDATAYANKQALFTKMNAIPIPQGNDHHKYQGKEMFFEFFRYLTGQDVYNGHLGFKDYGDTDQNTNLDADFSSAQRDISIETNADNDYDTPGTYISPLANALDCSRVFSINFMFGVTQQEDDSDTAIEASIANGGMGVSLHGHNDSLDTLLHWMNNVDLSDNTWGGAGNAGGEQNVTSYFITEGAHNTADGWASSGGTTEAFRWSDDPAQLVADLEDIFSQILSVSTTFTAASVPVSVLNRAQIVDNVYIALFKADKDGFKRWPGNLKKLRLNTAGTFLVDSTGSNAVSIDGRIKHDALTYWTDAANLPAPDTSNNEVAGKDGRAVQRGGAGQKIPGYIGGDPGLTNSVSGARQLYYEPAGTNITLAGTADLNADATTVAALKSNLGTTDDTVADGLLKYIRGYDNSGNIRSWLLGDPLHSRPLPINYGALGTHTDANPDIRIVMGSNDGFLHMFKNTTGGTPGSDTGAEVWAYMPKSVMGIISDLKTNPAGSHPYGVDGPPTVYVKDTNNDGDIDKDTDGDIAWVFFGLRRGGKAIYALDVSKPDDPKKLWTIEKTSGGDFDELGYTFSQPRVAMLKWGSNTVAKPVLMFAGGYDINKDNYATNDSEGNAIYIVDAETGALVWKAVKGATTGNVSSAKYTHTDLNDSIPSTLTIVDSKVNDLIDRMYVGDTGGVIWRVDVAGTNTSNWSITKLASVGRHDNNGSGNDRRFFHRPDFVKYKDSIGAYDAVIIGSGNRAHPAQDMVNDNWFYMFKDRNITSGSPPNSVISQSDLGDVTNDCLQIGNCGGNTPNLTYGWKLELEANGEKALATATTLAKQIFFTTYVPPSGNSQTCEPNEGTGRLYVVSLENASAVNDYYVLNGTTLAKEDRFVTLDSGGIPSEVVYVPFNKILRPDLTVEEVNTASRWKTFWYPVED